MSLAKAVSGLLLLNTMAMPGDSDSGNLLKLELANGVTISVPADWMVKVQLPNSPEDFGWTTLGPWTTDVPIRKFSGTSQRHARSRMGKPFVARGFDKSGQVVALAVFEFHEDATLSQEDVNNFGDAEVALLDKRAQERLSTALPAQGLFLVAWQGTRRMPIGRATALVSSFRMTAHSGRIFDTRAVEVLLRQRTFTVTLGYLHSVAGMKRVCADILQSIRVEIDESPEVTCARMSDGFEFIRAWERAQCLTREEERIAKSGHTPTPAEAAWLAKREKDRVALAKQMGAEQEAMQRRKIAAWTYLVGTLLVGLYLAWWLGSAAPAQRPLRWSILGCYLAISVGALAILEARAWPLGSLVVHAHWLALLLLLVYRKNVRTVFASGWGRLFMLLWVPWAALWGYKLYESRGNEEDVLSFTFFGLFVPAAIALGVKWVVRGFRGLQPGSAILFASSPTHGPSPAGAEVHSASQSPETSRRGAPPTALPSSKVSPEITPNHVPYGRLWWTTTWPLVVATIVVSALAEDRAQPGPAFLWGAILAWLFSKKPETRFMPAFKRALLATVPVQIVLVVFLYLWWPTRKVVFQDAPIVVPIVLASLVAVMWSALSAFFVTRKIRRLAAAPTTELAGAGRAKG